MEGKPDTSVLCSKPSPGSHLTQSTGKLKEWVMVFLVYSAISSHSCPCSCHSGHPDPLLSLNWAKFALTTVPLHLLSLLPGVFFS